MLIKAPSRQLVPEGPKKHIGCVLDWATRIAREKPSKRAEWRHNLLCNGGRDSRYDIASRNGQKPQSWPPPAGEWVKAERETPRVVDLLTRQICSGGRRGPWQGWLSLWRKTCWWISAWLESCRLVERHHGPCPVCTPITEKWYVRSEHFFLSEALSERSAEGLEVSWKGLWSAPGLVPESGPAEDPAGKSGGSRDPLPSWLEALWQWD